MSQAGSSIVDATNTAWAAIKQGDPEAAFAALQPHVASVKSDERVALPWVHLLRFVDARNDLTREVRRFARQWLDNPGIILGIAESVAAWAERQALDAARPADGVEVIALQVLAKLIDGMGEQAEREERYVGPLHFGLARICAQAGPTFDERACAAFEIALGARPESGDWWLICARFHLLRRRYNEAQIAAGQAHRHLPERSVEQAIFVASSAATGAGDGEAALEGWQAIGRSGRLGSDGLPLIEGLTPVEVRLSGGEAVWVRPSSPCHGRVVSPTILDCDADFDDTILWDGVPLTFREVDGERVPLFAAIAVLSKGAARTLRYQTAGDSELDIDAINAALPAGCFLYPQVEGPPARGKYVSPLSMGEGEARAALADQPLALESAG